MSIVGFLIFVQISCYTNHHICCSRSIFRGQPVLKGHQLNCRLWKKRGTSSGHSQTKKQIICLDLTTVTGLMMTLVSGMELSFSCVVEKTILQRELHLFVFCQLFVCFLQVWDLSLSLCLSFLQMRYLIGWSYQSPSLLFHTKRQM